MFDWFKKKESVVKLYTPLQGKVIDVKEVPDPVFAEGMMGDGVAVEPLNETVCAPCDGEVMLIAKTGHAIGIQSREGLEVLIHIGLDTVELGGQGFVSHVKPGEKVQRGDKLISFDAEFIRGQGKLLITPMVITNMAAKVKGVRKRLDESDQWVMDVELKS